MTNDHTLEQIGTGVDTCKNVKDGTVIVQMEFIPPDAQKVIEEALQRAATKIEEIAA